MISQILSFVPFPLDQEKTKKTCVILFNFNYFNVDSKRKMSKTLYLSQMKVQTCKVLVILIKSINILIYLDRHLLCGCHLLNTIGKRTTTPYSSSLLDSTIKDFCKQVHIAFVELQTFVGKLCSITIIRQTLGTALQIPVLTRWLSWLTMLESFILNAEQIKLTIQQHRPEFLILFKKVYEDKLVILNAFRQVVGHLRMRIKNLEVRNMIFLFVLFLREKIT